MPLGSRIPGFYKQGIPLRRAELMHRCGLSEAEVATLESNLSTELADRMVENVVGVYALPFAVGVNMKLNGRDYVVPMVVEEPSVVAAMSNACRMIREAGGFTADADPPITTAQVQLWDVADGIAASHAVAAHASELLALANAAVPNLTSLGGGAREIESFDRGEGLFVVHLHVDVCDAMGANMVNTMAEAIAPQVAKVTGGRVGLRILTNLAVKRRVRVSAIAPAACVATDSMAGADVCDRIVEASIFAERDPYRAATHNKGIMNGIDPVVIATGNDWRAVEAGAHAFACQNGAYRPLAIWRNEGDGLRGSIELPLALGIVGGTIRVHPGAQTALKVLGARTAGELAMVAAAAGLASNLAALRALATEGIQRGHMSLHARSVAASAGAVGAEVASVAALIVKAHTITLVGAQAALAKLRNQKP